MSAIEENNLMYQGPLLPKVDYQLIESDDVFFSLTTLEADTLKNCCDFLEELKSVLLEEKIVQIPQTLVAHLCAYLGTVMAIHTIHDAEPLEPLVKILIQKQAIIAYQHFNQYPINSQAESHEIQKVHLEKLRQLTPGSILRQTMRLGRIMLDMLGELKDNRPIRNNYRKPEEPTLFCPQEILIKISLYLSGQQCAEWREQLDDLSDNYVINQLAIQIGWLMGYFSHLFKQPPDKSGYFEYGLPVISLYREYTYKLMKTFAEAKHAQEDAEQVEEAEKLLKEIRHLSERTQEQTTVPLTDFQQQFLRVKIETEKVLMDFLAQGYAIKIILMSVFYFWFRLEASFCTENAKAIDKEIPFVHMGSIIELVKKTASALPQPTLTPELQALVKKREELKRYFPDPESLDTVPHEKVAKETAQVNTAIYTIIENYMKSDINPEAIANALFCHWLRFSIFFGVSENEWQKMDYYLVDLLKVVKDHITKIFQEK